MMLTTRPDLHKRAAWRRACAVALALRVHDGVCDRASVRIGDAASDPPDRRLDHEVHANRLVRAHVHALAPRVVLGLTGTTPAEEHAYARDADGHARDFVAPVRRRLGLRVEALT